jgi:hypothetical protein
VREIIAALLRSRGYTHDDGRDPYDLYWSGPTLGIRPILVCVAHEMNRDMGEPTPGWDTYTVSVARRSSVVPHDEYEHSDG